MLTATFNRHLLGSTAIISAALIAPAYAAPAGGAVTGGQAIIWQSGNTTTVNQSSSRTVIDWSSFNVGANESVHFNQPSSSSIALNRIHDASPSQIDGALSANGQVWLINPNGMLFGASAQVNVAGLLATASDISNAGFLAGGNSLTPGGNPNATIANAGHIAVADGGVAALAGPNVGNSGLIEARLGKVALASGDSFTVDLYGDGLINLKASPAINSQLVSNSGAIVADGGHVLLTAAAAGNVVNSLINMDGIVQADSVGTQNGSVTLYAEGSNAVAGNVAADKGQKSGSSEVLVSGTISASGKGSGATGGSVQVLGDHVGLLTGSMIDVSGDAGGGTVRIGGDFHGAGSTPTASATIMQSGATIDAGATGSGNGGNVTVWSDGQTGFYGSITARGGASGGNGGFVETSGHQLDTGGQVDAAAPRGTAGTWLLDPADVTISTGTDANESGNPNFTPNGSGESVINVSDITTDLNAGTSVTITTGGDAFAGTNHGQITVATPITLSSTSNNNATLTLSAYSNIVLNANDGITAPTTGTGKLNVILDADNGANTSGVGGNGSGYILINSGASITTNGGNINMGGGALSGGLPSGRALGSSSFNYGIEVLSTVNAGGGNIVMYGQGGTSNAASQHGILVEGTVETSGPGSISLTGIGGNATTSGGNGNWGVVVFGAGNSIQTASGNIVLSGTGGSGSGGNNGGFYLNGASSTVQSGSGNITIIGIPGTGTGSTDYGFLFANGVGGASTTGNILIQTDSFTLNNSPTIKTSGAVTIEPYTGNTSISLSGGNITMNSTKLPLSDISGESSLTIGNTADTGTMTLAAGNWVVPVSFISGNSGLINVTGTQTGSGNATISFTGPTTLGGNLTTANQAITLGGPVTLSASDTLSAGSGAIAFGSTADGAYSLTATGGSMSLGGALGGVTPLAAVSLTSTSGLTLPAISASSIFADATGAASDLTLSGVLTASGSGNALTLVAGRNFIDSAGATDLSLTGSGRWLIYSTNPASNTIGGLTSAFDRYSCSYTGSCPSFPASSNGLLYSYTPTLTITPNAMGIAYGAAAPTTDGYTVSGYLTGADQSADSLSGTAGVTTPYTQGSNVGSYNLTAGAGTLTDALGYGLSFATRTNGLTVSPATLTVSLTGIVDKQYNANTTATLAAGNYTLAGVYGSDSVAISTTIGLYDNPNVGTGKTVSVSGLTLSGAASANYTLASTTVSGNVGEIDQAPLTVTAKNVSMAYADGTTLSPASGFTSSGLLGSDSVTSATLASNASLSGSGNWNAGTWSITPSAALGTGLSNYSISYVAGTQTISAKTVSLSGIGATNKVYDATTADTLDTSGESIAGKVSGDAVSIGNGSASFADANAGSNKTVTATGFVLSGADAGDYSLTGQPSGLTASITQAALTVTAKNASMTYADGTALNGTTGFTESGLLGSDSINSVSLASNATLSGSGNWNAGTWAITPSAALGSGLSNYAITYANGSETIAAKSVSLAGITANGKTYDATTGDTLTTSGESITGKVSGDNVSISNGTASFADPNAGVGKTITATGFALSGADAGDYSLTGQPSGLTASITPASLTVTAKNVSMTYADGTTLSGTTAFTSSGLLGGDAVSSVTLASNATLSGSGNWNAGTWSITPSAALGTGLSNYIIAYAAGTQSIAAKAVSITGVTANGKTYDATTSDTLTTSGEAISGKVSGDNVTISNGSASFADANAGTGKTVTASGFSLTGAASGDYTLSAQPSGLTATITPAALTVTADNQSKAYGSSDRALTYAVSGLVGGQSAADVLSGSLSRNAGANVGTYAITLGSLTANSNYALSYVPGIFTITAANLLAVAADNKSMTYGGLVPTLTYSFSGLVNGDNASVFTGSLATGATSASNVGAYAITQGTLSAGGNYTISFTPGTLTVNPAPLTVIADSVSKPYHTPDPLLTYSYSGLVTGDTDADFTGELSRAHGKNPGSYAIAQGTLAATGNYVIADFIPGLLTIESPALDVPSQIVRLIANYAPSIDTGGESADTLTPTVSYGYTGSAPAFTNLITTPVIATPVLIETTPVPVMHESWWSVDMR
jgi:filamentous hemagglutinin family protein